jgi:DNA-binding IclR family transcriptional regulator
MAGKGEPKAQRSTAETSTLDLALRVVEFLAYQSQAMPLAAIAQAFDASKATIYRHLQTLKRHGFVRQDEGTGHYEAGVKLMVLGEATRGRFDILAAARSDLLALRDQSGHAVTVCKIIDGDLVVLELFQGRTVIEFSTRPGTRLAFHASAHGKIWLAFGPDGLLDRVAASDMKAWTPKTLTDPAALRAEVAAVRAQGWSTAPDEVITGVNTVAAPVYDHRGVLAGSVAIVGATQFIPARPSDTVIDEVVGTARRISSSLGWRK